MKPRIDPVTSLVCLILLGIIVAALNAISLIISGNSRRSGNRQKDYPLLWLLSANILIGIFPLPIYGLKKYEFQSTVVSGRICDGWRYTYFVCIHVALASLVVMTMDKIIHLKYPLRYQNIVTTTRLNIVLGLCWLFYIIFDMIPFFPLAEYDDEMCHYVVKKDWAVAMNIISMAIPLPFIAITYSYMIFVAYNQAVRIRSTSVITGVKKRKPSVADNIKLAVEVKATRKVVYIIGSYILCWVPSTIYYLLNWLCPHCYPSYYEPHKTWIRFFFKLLVMFHAFVTPVVFCWHSISFRKDAKKFYFQLFGKHPRLKTNLKGNSVSIFTVNDTAKTSTDSRCSASAVQNTKTVTSKKRKIMFDGQLGESYTD